MRKKVIACQSRGRILVCDDDKGVIDSLSIVMEREGYYVDGVQNGLGCIHKIQDNNYDLLILDYMMEGLHGDEIAAMIRKFSSIWIILLTGHKDLAPPIESIRNMQIQGYCEKSEDFSNIIIQAEIGLKALQYMKTSLFTFKFKEMFTMIREYLGYSQEDIANLINVHKGTVIDWEKGRSLPSSQYLEKLSDLFGVSIDVMFGRILQNR